MMYLMTHKEFKVPGIEGYIPVLVGAINRQEDYGYFKDSVGDNISEKNSSFCELTGVYWLWKNTSDDYIGIDHYRRFFNCSLKMKQYITEKEIRKILNKYDIILPFRKKVSVSIEAQYCERSGKKKDLKILREIIAEKYPEYVESFDHVMNSEYIFFFNMLITKKQVYDDYCKWLFSILFEAEKRIDISDYDNYQRRIYGFMGERLLNVYVKHNKLKVFQTGVVLDEKWGLSKRLLTGVKRRVYYYYQLMKS